MLKAAFSKVGQVVVLIRSWIACGMVSLMVYSLRIDKEQEQMKLDNKF